MTTARGDLPSPRQISRKERSGWVAVTITSFAALIVALTALAHFAIVGVGNALSNVGEGFGQLGVSIEAAEAAGTAANAAAFAVGPQRSPSASVLNALLTQYQWVDGSTNVPSSSAKR